MPKNTITLINVINHKRFNWEHGNTYPSGCVQHCKLDLGFVRNHKQRAKWERGSEKGTWFVQKCTAEGVQELPTLLSGEPELKVLEKEDGLPSLEIWSRCSLTVVNGTSDLLVTYTYIFKVLGSLLFLGPHIQQMPSKKSQLVWLSSFLCFKAEFKCHVSRKAFSNLHHRQKSSLLQGSP